ncbi:hypothetical protein D3C80_513240 [compost metagenome]
MNIYLVSGLGADKRAFQRVTFPANYRIHHVEWIEPKCDESISSYALRLSTQINISEPFCLIGLSFGGMIVVEMLDFLQPVKTIIISSVSNSGQIPWFYKIKGTVKLLRFIPLSFFKSSNTIIYWLFGLSNKDEKQLFKEIINDSDPNFMKWAIAQVLLLKMDRAAYEIIHIHGNNDKILPMPTIGVNYVIDGGGHFMVFNKAFEISTILASSLN